MFNVYCVYILVCVSVLVLVKIYLHVPIFIFHALQEAICAVLHHDLLHKFQKLLTILKC